MSPQEVADVLQSIREEVLDAARTGFWVTDPEGRIGCARYHGIEVQVYEVTMTQGVCEVGSIGPLTPDTQWGPVSDQEAVLNLFQKWLDARLREVAP